MILKIKNEQGQTIRNIEMETVFMISFVNILQDEYEELERNMPLIRHIDLYTDTYVNSTQAEMYIKEFQKLFDFTKDDKLKKFCEIVIFELKNLDDGDFLVFFGD